MLFYEKHTKYINSISWLQLNHPLLSKRSIVCNWQDLVREHSAVSCHDAWCFGSLSFCRPLCKKWELLFIKHGVKVNGQYCWNILVFQQMVDDVDHKFCLSSRQCSECTAVSCVHAFQVLQCKTLNFLSADLWPRRSPELNSTDYDVKRIIQQREHELQVTRLN